MSSEPFAEAVAQTIDALSFLQTHQVDLDFRAHTRATIDSIRSLQREERHRINLQYSARAPSPDFLGTQLLAGYRGEAASVQQAKASGDPEFPTAITSMTRQQCFWLKREIKVYIHEWERSVEDVTGQSGVIPEHKAPLRSIYELYKELRNKTAALKVLQENSVRSVTYHDSAASQRRGSGTLDTAAAPSAASAPSVRVSQGSPRPSTDIAAGGGAAPTAANEAPAGDTAADKKVASFMRHIPRAPIGTTPPELLSDADLLTEKRRLKYTLTVFETEFEKAYGERPSRLTRRPFFREYYRYSKIKDELSRRTLTEANDTEAHTA